MSRLETDQCSELLFPQCRRVSVQLGQLDVSERFILWRCLLRPMCPVMMNIPVRYLVRLLRLFVSILRVFVWWLPSIRSVCACLLVLHLLWVRLLTLSLIMFLMWLSGTRLDTKLLLTVPALASSSAFSLPQCPVWAFIHLICTVFSSASLVRALWQSLMDLLLCILLERASFVDWCYFFYLLISL